MTASNTNGYIGELDIDGFKIKVISSDKVTKDETIVYCENEKKKKMSIVRKKRKGLSRHKYRWKKSKSL